MRTALLTIAGQVNIAPGGIKIELLPNRLAEIVNVEPARVSQELLCLTSEFLHRKRGIETKLILENTIVPRDETLLNLPDTTILRIHPTSNCNRQNAASRLLAESVRISVDQQSGVY